MENQQYSDEINLKQLGKKIIKISKENRKKFTLILLVILIISSIFFINVIVNPSYKAEMILKTRFIKKDQLEKVIDKYNSSISNPILNPIDTNVSRYIKSSDIFLISVKDNEVDVKDKGEIYRFYTYRLFFNSLPKSESIEKVNVLIKDIQQNCIKDNEIVQNKILIQNEINELDSLIRIAYSVGNSYKTKLESGYNGQLLVMNDLYKGINELSNQKANLQNSLAMLQTDNIIFQTSPTILSKKTKYPIIFFFVGFFIWISICSLWIVICILFGDDN